MSTSAANGQLLQSIGYTNLLIIFEDQFNLIKAYVIPNVTAKLILGVDFLRHFQICPKYLHTINTTSNRNLHDNLTQQPVIHGYDTLSISEKTIAENIVK